MSQQTELRERWVYLASRDATLHAADILTAQDKLEVVAVNAARHRIVVRYLIGDFGYRHLLRVLEDNHVTLSTTWFRRLQHWWYSYLDDTARQNLKHKAPDCCGNPTQIYAKRRDQQARK